MSNQDNPFLRVSDAGMDAAPSSSTLAAAVGLRKERSEEPRFRLADAQWLRAQRVSVSGEAALREFQGKLHDAARGIERSQGHAVGMACALTIFAVLLAVVGIAVGIVIMNVAGDWMTSMREA